MTGTSIIMLVENNIVILGYATGVVAPSYYRNRCPVLETEAYMKKKETLLLANFKMIIYIFLRRVGHDSTALCTRNLFFDIRAYIGGKARGVRSFSKFCKFEK